MEQFPADVKPQHHDSVALSAPFCAIRRSELAWKKGHCGPHDQSAAVLRVKFVPEAGVWSVGWATNPMYVAAVL